MAGTDDFYRAAGALRGADKKVLGELATAMRRTAKPVVSAIRDEVRKAPSQGRKTAASVERQLHVLARRGQRPLFMRPLTERQARSLGRRAEKASSLRENIASATGSTVSTKPGAVSMTFRVRSGQLPPSQRKLARRWNRSSGWRHPVFGNRNVWVKQVGRPYFDKTIGERRGELDTGVLSAMQAAAEKIVNPGGMP